MGFWDRDTEFAGKQIVDIQPDNPLPDPATSAVRIALEYDSETNIEELMSTLLEDPAADQVSALVIGPWSEEMFEAPPNELVERLVAAADQLPSLNALFFGDITAEDCEISWITQTDLSPFWQAFPKLETLRVRGGNDLSLGKIESNNLKTLIIETGGLGVDVIRQIADAKLPALEHLEIYSGTDEYGWNGAASDFQPFTSDALFPNLQYLGLRNCECADEVAEILANAPVLDKIKVLDLSLGCLGDQGATALLNSDKVLKLKKLDLHYHYLSDDVVKQLSALPIETDVTDGQGAAESVEDRYCSVSE
ncbi:MAG: STM4015 family protein [Mariniblastus sp.]